VSKNTPSFRIGIYGPDDSNNQPLKSFGLWAPGFAPAVTAAGGIPVPLQIVQGCSWDDILEAVDGVVFAESRATNARQQAAESRLCEWCQKHSLPFLGVDQGLHVLNTTFGGTLHLDVSRELPDALQHRQPPEPGVRHAIAVTERTRLARLYGEGEIVVNSEHRKAVCKPARGFVISARALDGVIEAIECEAENWFAMGVQWHPASATASGLDIQLFRGLIEACESRQQRRTRGTQLAAA
jgi:putative glutamine amidotransferase